MFGSFKVQAETDWLIDRLWGAGHLTDRQRDAAQRLNALIRGRLLRIGAPRAFGQSFCDAGRGHRVGPVDDASTLDLEHRAVLLVIGDLDRREPGVREALIGAVAFDCMPGQRIGVVRVGLDALAAHFSRTQRDRLAIVRDRMPLDERDEALHS
jgi:hypothetical protein